MKRLTKVLIPTSLGCALLIGTVGFAQDGTRDDLDTDDGARVERFRGRREGFRGDDARMGQRDGSQRGMRRHGGKPGGGDGAGRDGGGRRGGRGRHGPGGGDMLRGLLAHGEELGLTDDQTTQIEAIATESRKASVELRAASELARIELGELMQADDPDLAAIQGGLQAVADAQVAERFAAIEAGVEARDILTDEQQAKVKDAMKGRGGPGGRRGGNGPGGRRGGHGGGCGQDPRGAK